LWAGACVASCGIGLFALWAHAYTPGNPAQPPVTWPAESVLARSATQPTVLFFVHPRCPCTRVSVATLEALLPTLRPAPQVHVVALVGPELGPTANDCAQEYGRRLSASVHFDDKGHERHRFRAFTSGQVLVYDTSGRLVFDGGLTAARGHTGPNPGQTALLELLTDQRTTARAAWPVFGCSLDELAAAAESEARR